MTRTGVDRILKFAFDLAATRPKKHLTSATSKLWWQATCSAPHIARREIANSAGQIWSASKMLDHFGETEKSSRRFQSLRRIFGFSSAMFETTGMIDAPRRTARRPGPPPR